MKKKILIMAIAASLLALTVAGTSIAYFTDTDEATNVFTVGEVNIQLTEAKVTTDANGWNIIEDTSTTERFVSTGIAYDDIRTLWPGQSIAKDPTIENIGSEKAFVGAIITIKNVQSLLATDAAREAFIVGGAVDNTNNTVNWVVNGDDLVIYVIVEDVLAAKTGKVELFESIKVDANWDNDDMALFEDFEIQINAYAVQQAGFDTAIAAFTAAFGTEFGLTTTNP